MNKLIALFYICIFTISINNDKRSVLRDISYGSFGAFVILTVIVLVMLSDGDALSGIDLPFGGRWKA